MMNSDGIQGNLADFHSVLYETFLGDLLSGKQGLLIVQYEMESEQIYCGPAAESLSPYIA